MGNLFALEKNLPLLGLIQAVDTIQTYGLAGPVGSDQGKDLPFLDLQANSPEGFHAAERNINVLEL
jgi:hypothetical protein